MAEAAAEEQFGPYVVYERLGVGGMATVHRALERGGVDGFERVVALKRLLPHLAEDASFIKSFVREAKLASALSHVNIVQIYELGRVGAEYFISMEYIDGRDVRSILRHARRVTGPPPLHVTVGILLQLCDALDYAHAKVDDDGHPMGLVHRDVSPSNLLVTTAGHLKVIDFGIAKAQSAQLRTQTGRVKGKLAYMAPEAIAGRELDARSDLFACGVIAHELLTARPLFASKNEYQTLLKVERGDIMPPSTFNHACPPELDQIVLGALARDPDDRPTTAGALREQLQTLRRLHKLQATAREIASWCEWAFSLEAPTGSFGGSGTLDQTAGSSDPVRRALAQRPRTPRPATPATPSLRAPSSATSTDDDDAVEIAWGGGEQDGPGAPIVLDDVPDVSEKHLAQAIDAALADNDDIPTPLPSHGSAGRLLTRAATARRDTGPQGKVGIATGTQPIPRAITSPGVGSGTGPQRRVSTSMATANAADTQPSLPPTHADGNDGAELAAPIASVESPPPSQRMPRTKPGIAPARAETSPLVRVDDTPLRLDKRRDRLPSDLPIADPGRRRARTRARPSDAPSPSDELAAEPSFGAHISGRQQSRTGWWLLGLVVVAGGGVGAWYVATHRTPSTAAPDTPPTAPPRSTVTVKFVIEPADSQIRIGGADAHAGSPWTAELEPGVQQIEIHRDGYKAWLTSLELSAGETQNMRVVLEPLGTAPAAAAASATLILSSTPLGLEAVLDGTVLEQRTPIKMPIAIGPHTIALRDHGTEVWRQDLTASASTNYEFSPSMDAAKLRERAERSRDPARATPRLETYAPAAATTALPTTAPTTTAPVTTPRAFASPQTPAAAMGAPIESIVPLPLPAPSSPPTPAPLPAAPSPSAAAHAGPIVVAPSAVTRVAGDTPSVHSTKSADLPAVATAKVCIDTDGHVTAATILTKLDHRVASELTTALDDWRYAPYRDHGIATAACFVVSFRLR